MSMAFVASGCPIVVDLARMGKEDINDHPIRFAFATDQYFV